MKQARSKNSDAVQNKGRKPLAVDHSSPIPYPWDEPPGQLISCNVGPFLLLFI